MTAIQENNYKQINNKQLFENFCSYSENLSTEFGDLRLNGDYFYIPENDILKDIIVTDMAMDRCDTLYLIDNEKKLYKYQANGNILKKIGNIEEILPLEINTISAVGVDKDTVYIADYILQHSKNQNGRKYARLIAFTKRDFQVRWILSTDADGCPLNIIHTIACDNRGKVYVIEENTIEKTKNKIFYIKTCDICDPALSEFNLMGNENLTPVNLTVDGNGSLYVLFGKKADNIEGSKTENGEKGYILKICPTKKETSISTVGNEIPFSNLSSSGIAVSASKQIFISEYIPNTGLTIHKLTNNESDAWIPLTIPKLANKTFKSKCSKLITDSKGNLYAIYAENKLTLLTPKKLNLQCKEGYFEGVYVSKPIDSQAKKTKWHRILLDGEFKSGTQVDFQYYISDERFSDQKIESLSCGEWNNCISKASAIQGNSTRDALFLENFQGRYLWFKLTLSGSEILSPVIKSITVFFPRVSYLDYLPAIYQEDSISKINSKGLLERFLAIFESIFFEIDFKIDHIGRFFDAYGVAPEFLSWLGSWIAVSMDEDWPEDKKRLFIRNAISLYKKRGTREGLEESIELFTGKKPFIVEKFQASKTYTGNFSRSCNKEKLISFPSQAQIFFPPSELKEKKCAENYDEWDKNEEQSLINRLYGNERFGFSVLLTDPDLDTIAQSRIRRIIEEQKPAHTSYELRLLEPLFYLDMHTYLEINTVVVTEPKFVLEKTSMLGRYTILHDEEKAGQIERHSRAGIDTTLS